MKVSNNFIIQEFVPKSIYDVYLENSIWFIDKELASGSELVRSALSSVLIKGDVKSIEMVINNWCYNGSYHLRGFRPPDCKEGAKLSQHKFGNAIDFEVWLKLTNGNKVEVGSFEVQKILTTPSVWDKINPVFTTIEKGTSGWTHLDKRYLGDDKIKSPNVIYMK